MAASARPELDPEALAYRWRKGNFEPIRQIHRVAHEELLNIDRQKAALLQNTRQFIQGLPANHALLTGARGTGKSSLVKSLLAEFAEAGLRLVDVPAHELLQLHEVVGPLRDLPHRYILYVDDFSVSAGDPALSALKAALDGDLEAPASNVLIYATSNRRHLMPEFHSENQEYRWDEGELQPGESSEEKISLSERFGLWLSFPAYDQAQFLRMVSHHLRQLGIGNVDAQTEKLALRWSLNRASRSGRVAMQFARDFAGRQQL